MDSFNIGSLSDSQLIDHLQNAVMEEDFIYTVFWLRALGKRGVEDGAVKLHSWRMTSALSTICVRSHTNSRLFILQILLSKTSKRTLDSEQGKIALEASKEWSRWVVSAWYLGGKEQAQDAAKVLRMRSKDAEEWISKNLPPHPQPESCTRRSALPGPPGVSRTTPTSLPLPPRPLDSSTLLRRPTAVPLISEVRPPSPIRLYITGFSQDMPDAVLLDLSATLGVHLFDSHIIVKRNGERALICSVSTKASVERLIQIIEKPEDPYTRVHLALPRDLHLPHHYVLIKPLVEDLGVTRFRRWAKQTRCGPFDERIGWIGQERVGLFRVETAWGADQAAKVLAEPTAEHPPLRTFWGPGHGPVGALLSAPLTLTAPPHSHAERQASARSFGIRSSLYTQQVGSVFEGTQANGLSRFSLPKSRSTSASYAPCTGVWDAPLSCLSLPAQIPSLENGNEEFAPLRSPSEAEGLRSPTSPPPLSSTYIDLTSSSPEPEPVPFAIPDSNFVSSQIAETIPSLPFSSTDLPAPQSSHSTSSRELMPQPRPTDRQIEFALLVDKRLNSRNFNLRESFLFSSTRRNAETW